MKSAFLRKNAGARRSATSRIVSLPAPTGGWDTSQNLSTARPGTAQIMENWRPTTTGAAMRGGSRTFATASLVGDPVESLLTFNGSLAQRLFAATKTTIFDASIPDGPVAALPVAVSGQTSGYYSFTNITTSGDPYLIAVNGTDPLLSFSPALGWKQITDTSTPSITGIATRLLSFVWPYRNRLFFVERNTMRARFLPPAAIAGALGTIDLNGVFGRGGALLFGGSWSMDAGDGLDDKCVFVTTEGEVAIFQGSNPASANPADWSLVGRYDIARPLGPRATMRAGGDLVIATADGLVPLSAAVEKDVAALNFAAISRPIAAEWQVEGDRRQGQPWEIQKWPEKGYAVISQPIALTGQEPGALVVNTVTGAWCRYTNWDTRCLATHRGQLYFGTADGRVKMAEVGGSDDGAGIYYRLVGNPEHLGARGALKTIRQARATYTGTSRFRAQLTASMNYTVDFPSPPDAIMSGPADEWDAGLWDEAVWDAAAPPDIVSAEWVSIGRSGHVVQYQLQVTGGLRGVPDTELVSIDVSFDTGGAIV